MKQLTKSDLINIESFKSLLKMLNNDIKDVKQGILTPQAKAKEVFKISIQRSQLIANVASNYPQINWINEAIEDTKQSHLNSETSRKFFVSLLKLKSVVKQLRA